MCLCKHCYEAFVPRSGKVMLYCRLLTQNRGYQNRSEQNCCVQNSNNSSTEKGNSQIPPQTTPLSGLCLCQRYCPDQDKYIPHQQQSGCKQFQSETK